LADFCGAIAKWLSRTVGVVRSAPSFAKHRECCRSACTGYAQGRCLPGQRNRSVWDMRPIFRDIGVPHAQRRTG
jgi:hypothetical protein